MGIKTFWYLTQADGDYPWSPGGLFPVDGARQIELAKTIDDGGFEGALVATWPNDPFISATWAAAHTTRMKFLVAVYANMTPTRLLAEKALTFDAFSGGRLLINSVNGRENILTKYDMNVPHDERYELGEQYWADFRRIYAEGTESNFPNTPLRIDAPAGHQVPLWGTVIRLQAWRIQARCSTPTWRCCARLRSSKTNSLPHGRRRRQPGASSPTSVRSPV